MKHAKFPFLRPIPIPTGQTRPFGSAVPIFRALRRVDTEGATTVPDGEPLSFWEAAVIYGALAVGLIAASYVFFVVLPGMFA